MSTAAAIAEAAERLRAGGLVAFPTETVYGLGADALSAEAVRRVFALKGRPPSNPLIVHVSGVGMARSISVAWPREADALAERFWPGPLTLVVPRGRGVPDEVTAGSASVAVRCPDHPIALELIAALGRPIVGPSANKSGSLSPTAAGHVRAVFDESEAGVLDGGPCRVGVESTVLSLDPPTILRPGAVTAEQIAAVLGEEPAFAAPTEGGEEGVALAPGRVGPHYRPSKPAYRVAPGPEPLRLETPFVLVAPAGSQRVGSAAAVVEVPADPDGYAAALYAALREAEAEPAEAIVVELPWVQIATESGAEPPSAWRAVADRLFRATTPL